MPSSVIYQLFKDYSAPLALILPSVDSSMGLFTFAYQICQHRLFAAK
jgi:hypothetical protein